MKKNRFKKISCLFLSAVLLGSVVSVALPDISFATDGESAVWQQTWNFNDKVSPFSYNKNGNTNSKYYTYNSDSMLVLSGTSLNNYISSNYLSGENAMTTENSTATMGYYSYSVGKAGYRPTKVNFKLKAVLHGTGLGGNAGNMTITNGKNTNLIIYPLTASNITDYQAYKSAYGMDCLLAGGAQRWKWNGGGQYTLGNDAGTEVWGAYTLDKNENSTVEFTSQDQYINTASTDDTATNQVIQNTEWLNFEVRYSWKSGNKVTISATITNTNSVSKVYQYTVEYNPENISALYNFGIKANSANNTILMDDFTYVSENPNVETDDTAIMENWGGYDDFTDISKTSAIWENDLHEKVSGDGVTLSATDTSSYTLSSAVWDSKKPLQFKFQAKNTGVTVKSNTTKGLRVYLLNDTASNSYVALNMGDYSYNATDGQSGQLCALMSADGTNFTIVADENTKTGTWSKKETNVWLNSGNPNADYYLMNNTDVPTYTISYDWKNWEESRQVIITCSIEGKNANYNPVTRTVSFVCQYTANASVPKTLNVGFQNMNGTATINNVSIKSEIVPEVLGATLSTSNETKRLPIRLGFDYTFVKERIQTDGVAPVAFGAVLVAGTPTYGVLKQNATTLLDNDVSNDVQGHTLTRNTLGANETLPDHYYITISNSDEDAYIGKRVSAISYIVLEKGGVQSVYFSQTMVQHSPMSVLKAIFNQTYLPENTESGAIAPASPLESALAAYNEGKEGDAIVTLDTIQKAIVKGTTNETQRTLLKQLHFSLCE